MQMQPRICELLQPGPQVVELGWNGLKQVIHGIFSSQDPHSYVDHYLERLVIFMMSGVFCLYGSATGKAQSIAEQIVSQAMSKGIEVSFT